MKAKKHINHTNNVNDINEPITKINNKFNKRRTSIEDSYINIRDFFTDNTEAIRNYLK